MILGLSIRHVTHRAFGDPNWLLWLVDLVIWATHQPCQLKLQQLILQVQVYPPYQHPLQRVVLKVQTVALLVKGLFRGYRPVLR